MKNLFLGAALVLAFAAGASGETIKLKLDGVKCDTCGDEIVAAIEKVPTAKLKEKPNQAKPWAVVDVDVAKSDIGVVAKAVADAETPHKNEEAPAAYLIVEAAGLTAANAKKVEGSLKGVKGVNAVLSSTDVKKKEIVVKLDNSGAAKLADIKKALADYTKK